MAFSLVGCRKSQMLRICLENAYEAEITVESNFYNGSIQSGKTEMVATAVASTSGIAPGMDIQENWQNCVIPKGDVRTVTVSIGDKVLRQWTYGDSQEDTPYIISNWKHDSSSSAGNTQYTITYIFK